MNLMGLWSQNHHPYYPSDLAFALSDSFLLSLGYKTGPHHVKPQTAIQSPTYPPFGSSENTKEKQSKSKIKDLTMFFCVFFPLFCFYQKENEKPN